MCMQLHSASPQPGGSRERIIDAAVNLFARSGFNGATTKEIAHAAKVSEGNIFRYFMTKRGLYDAAVDSQLTQLRIQSKSLDEDWNTSDGHSVLQALFERIIEVTLANSNALRLLQFSALEFGEALRPLYKRHFGPIVEIVTRNDQFRSSELGFGSLDPLITVVSFVATVATFENCYPRFFGNPETMEGRKTVAAAYADLWLPLLVSDTNAHSLEKRDRLAAATPE